MYDRFVIDASIAAKLYFVEAGSDRAQAIVGDAEWLDLLFIEMASLAAKNVRRGLVPLERAAFAVTSVRDLVDRSAPMAVLADRAFQLSCEHGLSAYDGAYLALAEDEGLRVLTADIRLLRRAETSGLSHLVQALAD